MTKPKLLVVNLQNPGSSRYQNPNTLGSFLLGRRLSNYAVFVFRNGKFNQVHLDTPDCDVIQDQIDKAMRSQQLEDN